MSDKFFFKGRQDARQDHTNHAYQTKAGRKCGSKKFPLNLVVTNETRKQEVQAMVAEAELHALVVLDDREGAVESISELTALLNTGGTVTMEKTPARNDPCHCGSGKKYKKCCA
ncbi:MAG: PBPRA1643 family SWIM/SEC-C metal-binding motif protein [Spongiibacteraceae bacterium]